MSFAAYQFSPNTLIPKVEESTSSSLIRIGVLKCFNAKAKARLPNMRLDLHLEESIRSGTFSKITLFSISVTNPHIEGLR